MTTNSDRPPLPSDRDLVDATRAGSGRAWAEVVERHGSAVHALASARERRGSQASACEALQRLHGTLVDDRPSSLDTVGQPAVRSLRVRALVALTGGDYGPLTRADPDISNRVSTTTGTVTQVTSPDVDADPFVMAIAFARLPEAWQTVLWHGLVEQRPASEMTPMLGRSIAEIIRLQHAAEAGLFDAYLHELTDHPMDPQCRRFLPLLGAYHRATLSANEQRSVDAHLGRDRTTIADRDARARGCDDCRRRLAVGDSLATVVPRAIVPGVTGLEVGRSRLAIGAGSSAVGAAALAATRSERVNRLARIGAVAAVIIALLGAAALIRPPFEDFQAEVDDLVQHSTTTAPDDQVAPTTSEEAVASAGNEIDLEFPEVPQGAIYVPGGRVLDLGLTLSAPGPVLAGGTGTFDAVITNNDSQAASATFYVTSSAGITFDALAQGQGSCSEADVDGATCVVDIAAGASAPMSLRFTVDESPRGTLRVDSSIASDPLEVPIERVPNLLYGQIGRGAMRTIGNTLGSCDANDTACGSSGRRNASSATLELEPGETVAAAFLLWGDERSGTAIAVADVGLITPVDATAASVSSEPGSQPANGSVADITNLVTAGGAGRYTLVRPPAATGDDPGDGGWSMVVVTDAVASPRRQFIVTAPFAEVDSTLDFDLDVPVPTGPPSAQLDLTIGLDAFGSVGPDGHQELTVGGSALGGDDPFDSEGDRGTGSGSANYDLAIDATRGSLPIAVSSTDTITLAALGLAVDTAP